MIFHTINLRSNYVRNTSNYSNISNLQIRRLIILNGTETRKNWWNKFENQDDENTSKNIAAAMAAWTSVDRLPLASRQAILKNACKLKICWVCRRRKWCSVQQRWRTCRYRFVQIQVQPLELSRVLEIEN